LPVVVKAPEILKFSKVSALIYLLGKATLLRTLEKCSAFSHILKS
jgi:hypothetical protein